MNDAQIKQFVEEKKLRPRILDKLRILSILNSAEQTAKEIQNFRLSEKTATIIFREFYEAIRQIGDAKWWFTGYEPFGHEISIDLLMEENPVEFKHMDRFRRIRNDANYGGYAVTIEQTKEIVNFWNVHGKKLLLRLKKEVK